ncbi:MAG: tetratricopeptide repeat protein [Planctomycetota bacterium]|jgi:hypothetical protein
MNRAPDLSPSSSSSVAERLCRVAPILALLASVVVALMLGVRTMTSEDLGYHLAYGERFWRTGEIVDHDDSLYTLPSADMPPEARPEPMPSAWYDSQDRFRFPNANWLTQVIFAGVYLVSGWSGLNVLLMLCVWGLLALLLLTMRRMGVGPLGSAIGLLLFGSISYLRFTLRPELLGYLVLAGQLALLARISRDTCERRLKAAALVGLVVLQLLLVNLHSFFVIGVGLTGAVLLDAAARTVWRRVRVKPANRPDDALSSNLRRLGVLVVLQVAVCFANPWTWRLAVLPVRSAMYLAEHKISTSPKGDHPWSWLQETDRTFLPAASEVKLAWESFLDDGFRGDAPRALLTVALVVALTGGIAAVVHLRWAWVVWTTAGMYLSLSMHRSMAVGTMIMLPIALAGWREVVGILTTRAQERPRAWLSGATSSAIVVICLLVAWQIGTSRFYHPRHQIRFGMGRSRVMFPRGPAEWLNSYSLAGRLWTDFITSSNLYFLLDEPRPQVPILTNGWAYPPDVMGESLEVLRLPRGPNRAVRKYGISAIVVRTDQSGQLGRLYQDPDWALVYLDGAHAIMVRKSGPDGDLAREHALTPAAWDAEEAIRRAHETEIWPAYALNAAGRGLVMIQWRQQALAVLNAAIEADPAYAPSWETRGRLYASRAKYRRDRRDARYMDDFRRALADLQQSLALNEDPNVRKLYLAVRDDMQGTSRRRPWNGGPR